MEKFYKHGLPGRLPARLKSALKRERRLLELQAEVQAFTDRSCR
jgi:hypothetical protein